MSLSQDTDRAAELPADRAAAIAREAQAQAALAAALHQGLPALAAPWRARPGASTQALTAGLQAYQHSALAVARRALDGVYPVVAELVGEAGWAALAVGLWRAAPPARGDLGTWGAEMAAFVAQRPELAEVPYLADVARLEWALHCAGRAADAPAAVADLARLGTDDPDQLSLRWTPGACAVASPWPVVTLWEAHQAAPGAARDAAFDQARQALAEHRAETAWVWRQGWQPRVQRLPPAWAAFMAAMDAGQPLGPALSTTGLSDAFADWLAEALRQGWLGAVVTLPRPTD